MLPSDSLHPPEEEGGGPQQELRPAGGRTQDQGSREREPSPGGRLLDGTVPQPRGPQGAGWYSTLQETFGHPPCLQVVKLKLRMLIEEVRTLLEINNHYFTAYSGSNVVWLAGFMCSQCWETVLSSS